MTLAENNSLKKLAARAQSHLNKLCVEIPTRQLGSQGNQAATDYAAGVIKELGYHVTTPQFTCIDWESSGASCCIDDTEFAVLSSPYALGCEVSTPLRTAGSLGELQHVVCRGEVLLLHGELTREQLMPKGYPFYNPEGHQLIISVLEEKAPAAIIAATSRNPELAGAVYPFPLIEDGNFQIPVVHTTEEIGEDLLRHKGKYVHLVSRARRIPSTGCIVLGRLNPDSYRKVVLCAHIDAKIGTPGALDNAAGVVTLLLAGELLAAATPDIGVELLVMNGEDYYGANGELLYLELNENKLQAVDLFINMDGLGYMKGKTAVSFYNLTEEKRRVLLHQLDAHDGIISGEQWYQGDHAVMVMRGIPAVAITTEYFMELEREFAHTNRDVPALVSIEKLIETSQMIDGLIRSLFVG